MTERPPAPPEGELIKAALKAADLSQREAARRADISETRWRQIVSGYQAVGGKKVAFRSPDDTLARMAHVSGVTPEQLEAVDRPEAAAALRTLRAQQRDAEAAAALLPADSRARVDERWLMLEAMLRRAPVGLNRDEYDTLRGRISLLFAQSPEWRPPSDPPPPEPADPDPTA
jgi:transcriptional regulator with XRE-family HTH domain